MSVSVGITTYSSRIDNFFIPLLSNIKKNNDDLEVIVAINGDYDGFKQDYRKKILNVISEYPNTYPMMFTQFRSLSKLWNNCILNASNDYVLVLNDDISVSNFNNILSQIEKFIEKNPKSSFTFNNTFSHFCAYRPQIDKLGWFDERLLGIGSEDGDMRLRFQHADIELKNLQISGITNHISKKDCVEGMRKYAGKYSALNEEVFKEKYNISYNNIHYWNDHVTGKVKINPSGKDVNCYPFEKYFWKNRTKL